MHSSGIIQKWKLYLYFPPLLKSHKVDELDRFRPFFKNSGKVPRSMFLNLTSVLESVDRTVLWSYLSLSDTPRISFISHLYADCQTGHRSYDDLSSEFTLRSGIHQGCHFALFVFDLSVRIFPACVRANEFDS